MIIKKFSYYNKQRISSDSDIYVTLKHTSGNTQILTSNDSSVWTLSATLTGQYNNIAYGNGLFVVVGYSICSTSPDGITWTTQTIPSGNYYNIIYSNGRFIASTISRFGWSYSNDGIVWTSIATLPSGAASYKMTSGITVSNVNTYVAVYNNKITVSTNGGITWGVITLTKSYNCVTFGHGLFVAVGYNSMATSTNGGYWIEYSNTSLNPQDVTFGLGMFIGIGVNVSYRSFDGINWNIYSMPSGTYNGIIYVNGLFVAVGSSVCATSLDGITWTSQTIPSGNYMSIAARTI